MGSMQQAAMEETQRNYLRNRYYKQRAKLQERIRLYADNPGFVAVLRAELESMERHWKEQREKEKKRRSKKG